MSFQETIYKLITHLIFSILTLIKQFSKCNSFKPLNDSSQKFPYKHNVAVPGYPHRQLRGFRREEHTAAHVLCLFEPVGRVAQNMSKKAWATNRKRSMSVGIAEVASIIQKQKHTKIKISKDSRIAQNPVVTHFPPCYNTLKAYFLLYKAAILPQSITNLIQIRKTKIS